MGLQTIFHPGWYDICFCMFVLKVFFFVLQVSATLLINYDFKIGVKPSLIVRWMVLTQSSWQRVFKKVWQTDGNQKQVYIFTHESINYVLALICGCGFFIDSRFQYLKRRGFFPLWENFMGKRISVIQLRRCNYCTPCWNLVKTEEKNLYSSQSPHHTHHICLIC